MEMKFLEMRKSDSNMKRTLAYRNGCKRSRSPSRSDLEIERCCERRPLMRTFDESRSVSVNLSRETNVEGLTASQESVRLRPSKRPYGVPVVGPNWLMRQAPPSIDTSGTVQHQRLPGASDSRVHITRSDLSLLHLPHCPRGCGRVLGHHSDASCGDLFLIRHRRPVEHSLVSTPDR